MATEAHCAFCFESLAASLERRQPLSLAQVQDLWAEYTSDGGEEDGDVTDAEADQDTLAARPAAISRLLNHAAPSSTSSSSSLPSTKSASSSARSRTDTPATSTSSSRISLSSLSRGSKRSPEESHPLFVTWNTTSRGGHASLRGCIGTFQAQPLEEGLRSYALTSAFEDTRFSPIPASLLPSLQCCVTLLTNFSAPTRDPMDWTIGTHGIRISFSYHGRRYSSTYLPDVAAEQGWTKEEALVSLMRKAGWSGRKEEWRKVQSLEVVRYEGKKVSLDYAEFKEWRTWTEGQGFKIKPLN
ncbi:hypothetical protein MBLNU459_g7846t1 [Dothideomycetes sp. NU459]